MLKEEQPFIFSVYLMNHVVPTAVRIMELKELNWLCKHIKNVRRSQPCISMNFCTKFSKGQVLPCEIVKKLVFQNTSMSHPLYAEYFIVWTKEIEVCIATSLFVINQFCLPSLISEKRKCVGNMIAIGYEE